jgi:hypothetical protein
MIFDLLATTVLSLAPTFAVFNTLANKKMEEHLKASFLLAIVALIFGIPAVFESMLGLPSLALATVPTTTAVLPGGVQFLQIFTDFIVAIVTYWLAMIIATVVLKFGEIRFS